MNQEILKILIKDCQDEEISHLSLRDIRDIQQERLEVLMELYPSSQILRAFWDDFMVARNEHHENLLKIRRRRMEILNNEPPNI